MKKLVISITSAKSIVLIEGQLKYFKDNGYDTFLLGPKDESVIEYCKSEGCTLLPVKIKREISLWNDLISFIEIFSHFVKNKPDIVNLGTPKIALLGLVSARLLKIKTRIYTCRGFRFEHEKGFKRWLLIIMEKITVLMSHQVICIGLSVREFGISKKIFDKNKSIVIHYGSSNGICLEKFNANSVTTTNKNNLKKDLALDHHFVYGFVGRLIDRKGIGELFQSFNIIYQMNPYVRLLVVGPIEENQIKDKSIIEKFQNHNGIKMVGKQKDIPLYLSIMDVFILPAWWEGFGNVLIQAAAMGIPVISTTGNGSRDAVKNGFNGILVPPKSVDELINAMVKLYQDEKLRNEFSKNGIVWARNFDRKIIWDGIRNIYENI